MTIAWLVFIALVIFGLSTLWRTRRDESPAEILDRRLASGEISTDEYDRTRRAMSQPPAPPAAA